MLLQEISGEAAKIIVTPDFGLDRILSWLIDKICGDDVIQSVLDLVLTLSEKGEIFWTFLIKCGYMKLLTADVFDSDEQSLLAATVKNMTAYRNESIWGMIAEAPVVSFVTQIISGDSAFTAKMDCFLALSNIVSKGGSDPVRFVVCGFGDVLRFLPDFLNMEDMVFNRKMMLMLQRVIELCEREKSEEGTRLLEALRSESAVAAVTELVESHGKEVAWSQFILDFLDRGQ
jgi:hypothetical protein